MMRRKVIHDDSLALFQLRAENLTDVMLENYIVHRTLNDQFAYRP